MADYAVHPGQFVSDRAKACPMLRIPALPLFAFLLACLPAGALCQIRLEKCAEQFIGGNVANAPTLGGTAPEVPFLSNIHLCYRAADASFYAMEYWPEEYAPRWTAYKLSPENYGVEGCGTYTRGIGNCYVREESWDAFLSCDNAPDPFHADHMLQGATLGVNDFANTGHDRGHIAPRQSFSWHVCGAYQTFSMANMSPQSGHLNQSIWADLEQQILTWAFDGGPLYVVSGTSYRSFPHRHFSIYSQDQVLDPTQIYSPTVRMSGAVTQHRDHFTNTLPGDILRPLRSANPDRINDKVADMRMPTGYFAVVYRPAMNGEPERAIGFLLPHSFENQRMLADAYEGLPQTEAFWAFVARIDLIESASGIRFPGVPEAMKREWGDPWFMERRTGRNIRSNTCGRGSPQGVLVKSTLDERVAACIAIGLIELVWHRVTWFNVR